MREVDFQRVDGGVEALLGDFTAEHRGGVQMGEGGGRCRVGQVVGGDVDRLNRGDRTVFGGGDALLQLAHVVGQGGLIAHGGGHPAQQGGHLAARLEEAEDVVDEQQHVLMLHVPEILRHGQAAHGHPHTGSGGLVHLAEDQGGLFNDAGSSVISVHRSLPSRVRSPTPVKME